MIFCESAVILQGGRVLLTQRKSNQSYPFFWESPGGKREEGEKPEAALVREIKEEIGCTIAEVRGKLYTGAFTRSGIDNGLVTVTLWLCVLAEGEQPRPVEGQGLGWFTADEVRILPMLPANEAARDLLCTLLSFDSIP